MSRFARDTDLNYVFRWLATLLQYVSDILNVRNVNQTLIFLQVSVLQPVLVKKVRDTLPQEADDVTELRQARTALQTDFNMFERVIHSGIL